MFRHFKSDRFGHADPADGLLAPVAARGRGRFAWLDHLALALRLVGIVCLALWALTWLDQRLVAADAALQLDLSRLVADHWRGEVDPGPEPWPRPQVGEVVGRLIIPRLGVEASVLHGTDAATLRRAAVGHFENSPVPGEPGNVALAGHRDAALGALRGIEAGDLIELETPRGDFSYRVDALEVVAPDRVDVVESRGIDELTLITCHPFGFVGPAPRRFVVHARAVSRPAAARPGATPALY